MGYSGSIIPLQIANGGLLTDLSPDLIPSANLIKANNVQIRNGIIEKSPGSQRWNADPLPSGIVAFYDYWPNPGKQYQIVVTRDGRVYRYSDKYTVVEITPTTDTTRIDQSGDAPETLSVTERVCIVEGGKEFLGDGGTTQPAKVFIFTGNDPIQVIYGEETTRHNLLVPAADWDGSVGKRSYPNFGIIYVGRLCVFGNKNLPHFFYISSNTYGGTSTFMYGNEDFSATTFNTALFNIYPGDGERLKHAFKYKSKLWVLKYPRGLYSLEIPDIGVAAGWYFQKINDDVGTATITGTAPVQDDVWVINSVGAIQSLSATLNLGGVEAANMLKAMQIEKYMQQITNPLGFGDRQAMWHEAKNTVYFIYRSKNSQLNSLLLAIDFTGQTPKPTVITKDQPNILAIRRNVSQVEEMVYGSEDGYIYTMDRPNRYVGDPDDENAYTGEFQTPHLTLQNSANDAQYNYNSNNDKNFDFVEIEFIPTGNVPLYCDVYIDGRKTETISFLLSKSNQLNKFILNQSRLQGRSTRRQRKPIHGRGRTVSLNFYNSGLNENFRVTGVTVYARISGVDSKGSLDAGTKDNF